MTPFKKCFVMKGILDDHLDSRSTFEEVACTM